METVRNLQIKKSSVKGTFREMGKVVAAAGSLRPNSANKRT